MEADSNLLYCVGEGAEGGWGKPQGLLVTPDKLFFLCLSKAEGSPVGEITCVWHPGWRPKGAQQAQEYCLLKANTDTFRLKKRVECRLGRSKQRCLGNFWLCCPPPHLSDWHCLFLWFSCSVCPRVSAHRVYWCWVIDCKLPQCEKGCLF